MFKGSDILNKLISAGMLAVSVGFFSAIGHTDDFVVPGLLFGVGGLLVLLRRDRRSAPELEVQGKVERLGEAVAAMQAELGATQERLDRLTEEREFMRQLVAPAAAPPVSAAVPRPAADRASAPAPEVPGSVR